LATNDLGQVVATSTPSEGLPAGSNGQLQFNDNNSFGATTTLVWDNTSGFLGIGTTTPTSALFVSGFVGINDQATSTYEFFGGQGNGIGALGLREVNPDYPTRLGLVSSTENGLSNVKLVIVGVGNFNEFTTSETLSIGWEADQKIYAIRTSNDDFDNGKIRPLVISTGDNYNQLYFATTSPFIGINTDTPTSPLTVNGDIYIASSTSGIILTSPDLTCHRVTVSDLNILTANTITCP
jgi:hypothetical protein